MPLVVEGLLDVVNVGNDDEGNGRSFLVGEENPKEAELIPFGELEDVGDGEDEDALGEVVAVVD